MKMKRNSKRLVALMAAMMICLTFHAKTQDVVGKVIDKNNNPVPFVNVVLLSLPDSAFVQGAVTDACRIDIHGTLVAHIAHG